MNFEQLEFSALQAPESRGLPVRSVERVKTEKKEESPAAAPAK